MPAPNTHTQTQAQMDVGDEDSSLAMYSLEELLALYSNTENPTLSVAKNITANNGQLPIGEAVPRLMITQLVLANFKSYAGEVVIGPFHTSFTSIVGPNGSGKSNVIDAMLFVFGFRAAQIRLKKLSELIHKSSQFPNLTECRVTVHFQLIIDTPQNLSTSKNVVPFTIVPNSAFTITRSADSFSTSKYYIGDRVSSFTAVKDKLLSYGVDLINNRFLILQGEVEALSQMKPKATTAHETGLLEYLEDIIGTNKYIQYIEEVSKRLEQVIEEKNEKFQRYKLVEKEKLQLEGPKDEAMLYLQKKQTLLKLRCHLYEKLAFDSQKSVHNSGEILQQLKQKLNSDNEEMIQLQQIIDVNEKELSGKKTEMKKLNTNMLKLKNEFAEFENKDIKFREDLKHKKTQLKKSQSTISKLEKSSSDLINTIEANEKRIPQLTQKLNVLREKQVAHEASYEELSTKLKAKIGPLQEKMEELQEKLLPKRQMLNEKKQEVSVSEKELELYRERMQKDKSAFDKLTAELETIQSEMASQEKTVNEKSRIHSDYIAEVNKLKEELSKIIENENKLTLEQSELANQLEDRKSTFSQQRSQNAVISFLETQKNKGKLKGYFGRLGDLGETERKYDVAVSTACGLLNHVVVDTVATGKRCIELLKEASAGRASILVLEQMRSEMKQEMEQPFNPPSNSRRLFDCIKPVDQQFSVAFYFALKNTLVAENLQLATDIAFGKSEPQYSKQKYTGSASAKRHRVVTVDGKLIENSGAMSGGGAAPISGLIQLAGTKQAPTSQKEWNEDDWKALEKQFEKVNVSVENCHQQKKAYEKQLQQKSSDLLQAETAAKKSQLLLEELKIKLTEKDKKLTQLQKKLGLTQEEKSKIAGVEERLQKLNKEWHSIRQSCEELENKIAECEEKILKLGGYELRTQYEKREQILKTIQESELEMAKATSDVSIAQSKQKKAEEEKLSAEETADRLTKELEAIVTQCKDLENEALVVMSAFQEAEKQCTDFEKEMSAQQNISEKSKTKLNSMKSSKLDIQNKIDEIVRKDAETWKKVDNLLGKLQGVMKELKEELGDDQQRRILLGESNPSQPTSSNAAQKTEASSQNEDGMDVTSENESMIDDVQDEEQSQSHLNQLLIDKWNSELGTFLLISFAKLPSIQTTDIQSRIRNIEEELKEMKPNMNAISDYSRKFKECSDRWTQVEELNQMREQLRNASETIRKRRLDEFMTGFHAITYKLKEMYQMLTLGGDAELELVDSLDPFSEGILFSVRPPKKSWKNIQNLSGGEKTLSSLALVFALHIFKPTPLYVMDEIDAALDFKNVSIVGNYIKERTSNAQFIIISLRNNMFELADRLVGIYKVNDQTNSITIDPRLFVVPFGDNRGASVQVNV